MRVSRSREGWEARTFSGRERAEGSRDPHRFHRPAAMVTCRHLEVLIPHPGSQFDISIRVQLLLALSRRDIALKLVPRRVQLAQAVLERVAAGRGVA